MEFSLCCPCGETLIVGTLDAGRTRVCRCGVNYQVPLLSEMRKLDSEGAVFLPPVRAAQLFQNQEYAIYSEAEKLRLLERRGKLPLEQQCLFCCVVTKDVLNVEIECERSEVRPNASPLMYLVIALLSPLGAFYSWIADGDDKEVIGEDVIVQTPLRVCASCAPPLFAKPATVREKMLQMRLYQPLLREYPEATIRILD